MRTMRRGMHGWVDLPSFDSMSKPKKRLRHCVDNPGHIWAHPLEKDGSGFAQTYAHNPIKNFYFKAFDDIRVCFSYRDSYVIGSRFEHRGKIIFLLRSGRAYSTTTAQHMSATRAAVPKVRGVEVFTVPAMVGGATYSPTVPGKYEHEANLKHYVSEIAAYIDIFSRAKASRHIHWNLQRAKDLLAELKLYCRVFRLRMPKIAKLPRINSYKMRLILQRERIAQEKREAKRKAEREAWEAAHKAEVEAWLASPKACKHLGQDGKPQHSFSDRWTCERQQEQEEWEANKAQLIERWKSGEDVHLSPRFAYNEPVVLRVKDGEVQTSHHAEVAILGLAGAARLWRFLKVLKDAGRTYQRNGHSERIGHFVVESFDGATLHVGCHRIAWEECERIAPQVLTYETERGDVQQEEVN